MSLGLENGSGVATQELAYGFVPMAQIQPLRRSSLTWTLEKPAVVKSSRCSARLRSIMPVREANFSASFETVVSAPL